MPVLKVKKNGLWEELGGTSPMDGGNADTLDGKHASEFATVNDVKERIESALSNFSSGKTLTKHLMEEPMVLSSLQYGNSLPAPGTPGRIFFLRTGE